ncbi:MAG: hypothetical protein ACFFAO_04185 [Candidatus Hermodarchaeota archaeon]
MELINFLKIDKNQYLEKKVITNQIKTSKKSIFKLPLNSKNFDGVLDGGFSINKKYLIFGANRTGKTQICHQLSIQASIIEKIKKVYYFDTENTFRPERIEQMATGQKIDFRNVLKTIKVSKIMSNNALLLKLTELPNNLNADENTLIIIDSINNFYRLEQGKKEVSYSKIKKTFIKILDKIEDLLENYNLIIVATGQIYPNFVETAIIHELPVGNPYLNHYFSEYLYLSIKTEENFVQLVNSHNLPERKVLFRISTLGIEDYRI